MANRLLFDTGLHVDSSELRVSESERQIRHMLLWACILIDKYWAFFLGRPTSLKPADMDDSCLVKDFNSVLSCRDIPTTLRTKTMETRTYEALLQLMDIMDPFCTSGSLKRLVWASDAYFKTMTLDRNLNAWYAALPDDLKWTEASARCGPASFFLLQ
jgi:hypothetical protein